MNCGGCTACCTLLDIPALEKPAHQECRYLRPGVGCGIRKSRPDCCRRYLCLWITNPSWPLELRPDKCGLLLEPGGDRVILVNVDTRRPASWKEGIGGAFIKKCLNDGYAVIVQVGKAKHFLIPEGQTPGDVWKRVSEDAQQRGFV